MIEAKWQIGSAGRRLVLANWLTVEHVAYLGIALVALGLRLYNLALWPLGPAEAAQALPAYAASIGQGADLSGVSPLLFTLQRPLFTVFGAAEVAARWWPALLGGLATLLFWGLRDQLGRGGALMAGLLWAVSPMAMFTARLGLGQALVAPLGLALLVTLNLALEQEAKDKGPEARGRGQEAEGEGQRASSAPWLTLAAVALGLLLASGSGAYTVLLTGVAAAVMWRQELPTFWKAVKAQRRNVALGGLLALALSSTFFLIMPSGLAAAADLLGTWLRGLSPDFLGGLPLARSEYAAWDILRRLLLSETLLVAFGIAGLVGAIRRDDRFGTWAGVSAGIALLLPLIGRDRHPADLALVALALTLLAGPAVATTLRTAWSWRGELDPWLLVAISLVLLTSAAICLPSAYNPSNREDWQQLYTSVGLVTVILSVLLWAVYGIWGSWRTVARALPVVPLVFLLAWNTDQMTGLSYDRDPNRRASVLAEMPGPEWPEFRAELRQATMLHGTGLREAQVDLLLPAAGHDSLAPMLRWALRDYRSLRILTSLPPDLAPIVITYAEKYPALAERYVGADFTLLQYWRPESLHDFYSWLRWILYREAKAQAEDGDVVLWVERTKK
jgi:hypothetical protein